MRSTIGPARAIPEESRQADVRPAGPSRIVALGGGTGLPNVLRGLRPLLYPRIKDTHRDASGRADEPGPTDRLVAIVATSDDGGSSGKLRAEFNIIPPGDIRNCLAALSDNHALIADIFQYRFGSGEGLNGHTLGNLVLTALADVMNDFPRAVEIAARVVGARGIVLPATSEILTLVAEFEDGRILSGETTIAAAGGRIARLSIIPERPRLVPGICDMIHRADVIVVGPGSLYTSILPSLLVPEIAAAVQRSSGVRVLIANLMTEPGETDDYSALEHVLTIERHVGTQLFDYIIYNTTPVPAHLAEPYAASHALPIVTGAFELKALEKIGVQPIGVALASEHPSGKIRHHPERLGAAITALVQRKLGAWRGRAEAGGL